MIRAKAEERAVASAPVKTEAGTMYPAAFLRGTSKGLAYAHGLTGYLYGVEVLAGIGARIAVTGKDKSGVEKTVYELL